MRKDFAQGALGREEQLDEPNPKGFDFPYESRIDLIPIEDSVLKERTIPAEYLDLEHYDVTKAFVDWAKPLAGTSAATSRSSKEK